MIKSLWTAASGMAAQQNYVDTISNNIANVNTTGYKKQTTEFKTLLYQTLQEKATDSEGNAKPIASQVGLGVRTSAITSQFTQGSLDSTGNTLDFAINGDGFFMVQLEDGSTGYTRNGSFTISEGVDGLTLCDSDGHPVLDDTGAAIVLPDNISSAKLSVDSTGMLAYPDENNNAQSIGIQMGIAQFSNPTGLTKMSGSILLESEASGEAKIESQNTDISGRSIIRQGYLEGSNVETAQEMVDLIVAQRAYQLNSKVITASDEMLQQANNLRN